MAARLYEHIMQKNIFYSDRDVLLPHGRLWWDKTCMLCECNYANVEIPLIKKNNDWPTGCQDKKVQSLLSLFCWFRSENERKMRNISWLSDKWTITTCPQQLLCHWLMARVSRHFVPNLQWRGPFSSSERPKTTQGAQVSQTLDLRHKRHSPHRQHWLRYM